MTQTSPPVTDWLVDRDAGIAQLRAADPQLASTIDAQGPVTFQPHTDYYATLVDAIIGQQLSDKAASTILGRVKDIYEGRVPTPKEILATDGKLLRGAGLSWGKVGFLQDLATHVEDGRLNLAMLDHLPDQEIINELTAVKGIGEWTAQMFLIFCLGRLDVLPTGDLAIRKGLQALEQLTTPPSPAEMLEIAEKRQWHPYASIASWYVWRWLDTDSVSQASTSERRK